MGKQYRHGDVLIEEASELPKAREKLPQAILAYGEVTGHSHRLKESHEADLFKTSEGLYLHVHGRAVTVVHEEHASITIPAGVYRVWRQREYSPREIRTVRD